LKEKALISIRKKLMHGGGAFFGKGWTGKEKKSEEGKRGLQGFFAFTQSGLL